MEGSEAVSGSSVNFAVCTWRYLQLQTTSTDLRNAITPQPAAAMWITQLFLSPAASAPHPPPAPDSTPCVFQRGRTQARHKVQSPRHFPPELPTPAPPPLALCSTRQPLRITPYPLRPVVPPN